MISATRTVSHPLRPSFSLTRYSTRQAIILVVFQDIRQLFGLGKLDKFGVMFWLLCHVEQSSKTM